MINPTVAAVMLCHGRDEMARRAIRSFALQGCENKKHLLLWNNDGAKPIGTLRNEANAQIEADIIVHWDSDDWSHANRIAEQVALLRSSGAECVGYNEMLFWATLDNPAVKIGEAWLYRAAVPNYVVGTSMCYWRETWRRNPFPARSEGCDDLDWFNRGVKIVSESSLFKTKEAIEVPPSSDDPRGYALFIPGATQDEALMIASIHGENTCSKIDASKREWARVPRWDAYCREAMKL